MCSPLHPPARRRCVTPQRRPRAPASGWTQLVAASVVARVRRTHRREWSMSAKVREDLVLSHAVVAAEVEAPFDHVDIAQWLKTLPTHEYQRCAPPDHKAAGYTVDDDGTPMSINVEMIGTGLVVQQHSLRSRRAPILQDGVTVGCPGTPWEAEHPSELGTPHGAP